MPIGNRVILNTRLNFHGIDVCPVFGNLGKVLIILNVWIYCKSFLLVIVLS